MFNCTMYNIVQLKCVEGSSRKFITIKSTMKKKTNIKYSPVIIHSNSAIASLHRIINPIIWSTNQTKNEEKILKIAVTGRAFFFRYAVIFPDNRSILCSNECKCDNIEPEQQQQKYMISAAAPTRQSNQPKQKKNVQFYFLSQRNTPIIRHLSTLKFHIEHGAAPLAIVSSTGCLRSNDKLIRAPTGKIACPSHITSTSSIPKATLQSPSLLRA